MNRVQQLREVIKKLVPMIASRGITVTQVGAQAFVHCDKKTRKPTRVNIPHLPDDADEGLIFAVQGFIDHELGHVLDTDWDAVAESVALGAKLGPSRGMTPQIGSARLDNLHNIVEDPYVEAAMTKRFKGAGHNIDRLHDVFINRLCKPGIEKAKTPEDRFGCILVPLVRSWAGQQKFTDLIVDNGYDKEPLVVAFTKAVPASIKARLPHIKDSWEALEIAKAIFDVLHPEPPPAPPPPPSMADAINEEMKEQEKKDEEQQPSPPTDEPSEEKSDDADGQGDNQDKPEDEEDKGSKGDESEEQQPADQQDDEGDADKSDEASDEGDDAEGEQDKGDDDGEEGQKTEAGSEDQGKADGDDERDADSDVDAPDEGDQAEESDAGGEEDDGEEDGDSGDQAGGSSGSKDDDEDEGDEAADADAAGDDEGDSDAEGDEDGEDDEEADGGAGSGSDAEGDESVSDEGENDGDDDGEREGEDERDADDNDGSEASDDSGSSASGEDADGEVGSEGDDEDGQDDGGSRAGEKAEQGDEADVSRHDLEEAPESSPFQNTEIENLGPDLSTAISYIITNEATRNMKGLDYRVYTRDWDVHEKFPAPDSETKVSKHMARMGGYGYETVTKTVGRLVEELDERTSHMVAPMQKDIERMMAARSQILKVPGYRSGRLHSGSLHRLRTGDDRVFRRTHENKSKETAVSLLIDNSGSMEDKNKMTIAMAAGYALSSTLQRVGIKHEVTGFTTMAPRGFKGYEWADQQREEEERIGREFSRQGALYLPIYKGFDERVSPEVKRRFAAAPFTCPMHGNTDGESVRYAGQRLMLRPEDRKVLIVLSDGNPAGMSSFPDEIYSDLHKAVAECEKNQIETIGVGILDEAVRTFYPKCVVLKDLNELPKAVMAELKRILLQ